jgi:hypothetical protein
MDEQPGTGIERTRRHKLLDMVVLAICGMICGADDMALTPSGDHSSHIISQMRALS